MDISFDNCGDIIDVANRTEAMLTGQALAGHVARRRLEMQEAHGRPSATECVECGDLIPEARRQACPGCQRCVCCQTEYEREQQ